MLGGRRRTAYCERYTANAARERGEGGGLGSTYIVSASLLLDIDRLNHNLPCWLKAIGREGMMKPIRRFDLLEASHSNRGVELKVRAGCVDNCCCNDDRGRYHVDSGDLDKHEQVEITRESVAQSRPRMAIAFLVIINDSSGDYKRTAIPRWCRVSLIRRRARISHHATVRCSGMLDATVIGMVRAAVWSRRVQWRCRESGMLLVPMRASCEGGPYSPHPATTAVIRSSCSERRCQN